MLANGIVTGGPRQPGLSVLINTSPTYQGPEGGWGSVFAGFPVCRGAVRPQVFAYEAVSGKNDNGKPP